MALATRPKPPIHHRKRQAKHHSRSKTYLKAYHPYLPMLAIVGLGVIINQTLYGVNLSSTGLLTASGPLAATRIEVLTGRSAWALPAVVVITAAAAVIFAATHWYRLHRVISRGENYVIRHPWLDVLLVAIMAGGVILTRAA